MSTDEPTRAAGQSLLGVLAGSPLAGAAELDMLSALNDNTSFDRYVADLDDGDTGTDNRMTPIDTEAPDDDR